MDPRSLPSTKAYLRLREQVQDIFDFSVVVAHAVPALKRQISLINQGVITSLPTPDYYPLKSDAPVTLKSQAAAYKAQLAAYTLISVFSFFEAFVTDAISEMINFHGGQEEFLRRAEEHDKKSLSTGTPDQERAIRILRGATSPQHSERYRKYSRQLFESKYRFPTERFSGYGARMLIQKLGNMRSIDIPDLLVHGLHMDIDDNTRAEFHRIRQIRNAIAHGTPKSLTLSEVSDMNDTLKKLAYSVDRHLNEHFIVSEDYI